MILFHYIRRHRSGSTYMCQIECVSRAQFLETLAAWNRIGDGIWTYTEAEL